jgi:hypothetical protein
MQRIQKFRLIASKCFATSQIPRTGSIYNRFFLGSSSRGFECGNDDPVFVIPAFFVRSERLDDFHVMVVSQQIVHSRFFPDQADSGRRAYFGHPHRFDFRFPILVEQGISECGIRVFIERFEAFPDKEPNFVITDTVDVFRIDFRNRLAGYIGIFLAVHLAVSGVLMKSSLYFPYYFVRYGQIVQFFPELPDKSLIRATGSEDVGNFFGSVLSGSCRCRLEHSGSRERDDTGIDAVVAVIVAVFDVFRFQIVVSFVQPNVPSPGIPQLGRQLSFGNGDARFRE